MATRPVTSTTIQPAVTKGLPNTRRWGFEELECGVWTPGVCGVGGDGGVAPSHLPDSALCSSEKSCLFIESGISKLERWIYRISN